MKTLSNRCSLFFVAAVLVLAAGCQNPLEMPDKIDKTGTLTIAINGQNGQTSAALPARTVLPGAVTFSKYTLAFTAKTAGNTNFTETWTDKSSGSIDLSVGTWDVTVTGFNASNQEVASGTLVNLTVQDSGSVSENITLEPIAGGTGTFAWSITFDAEITGASLALVAVDGSGNAGHSAVLTPSGTQTGAVDLSAGQYRVSFTLSDGTSTRVITEIVHIYRNLTSNFTDTATCTVTVTAPPLPITYTLAQIGGGDNSADTTAIQFIFSEAVDNLDLSDIYISNGDDFVTLGDLTKAGSLDGTEWRLAIETVIAPGVINVTIYKDGISSESQWVMVYKENAPMPTVTGIVAEYYSHPDMIFTTETSLDDITFKNRFYVRAQFSNGDELQVMPNDFKLSSPSPLAIGANTIIVTFIFGNTFTCDVDDIPIFAPDTKIATQIAYYWLNEFSEIVMQVDEYTLYRAGNDVEELQIQPWNYYLITDQQWYINGVEQTDYRGEGTFEFSSFNKGDGRYRVNLTFIMDDRPYSYTFFVWITSEDN